MNRCDNLKNILSQSDAVLLLDLIHKSLSCRKEEDIRSLTERFQGLISCERAVSVLAKKRQTAALNPTRH